MAQQNQSKLKPVSPAPASFSDRWIGYFTAHRDLLGYMGVAILIIIALTTLVTMNNKSKETQASLLFNKGIQAYNTALAADPTTTTEEVSPEKEKNDFLQAENAFQEIIDTYPSTPSGKIAMYMLATVQLNAGDYEKATTTYQNFISRYRNHPMIPSAKLGLATAKFNAGQIDESQEILNNISTDYSDFPLMDVVSYEIAKRFEAKLQWALASQKYQEIIDKYPDSSWKYLAQKRKDTIDRKYLPADTSQSGDHPSEKGSS